MSDTETQHSSENVQRQDEERFIQLAGHSNSILPMPNRTIWKITSTTDEVTQFGDRIAECNAYITIMKEKQLKHFVPQYYRCETHNGTSYILLEDVSFDFPTSCRTLLDIKMGTRTFSILETSDKKRSSTALLGFRIEGTRLPGQIVTKGYERLHAREDVQDVLLKHVGQPAILRQLCTKLRQLRSAIENSNFFRTHEVIGNSILVVHDGERCGLWMIDFANTLRLKDSAVRVELDHRSDSSDGYLKGVDALISILEERL
ncbi:inositol polyphosphate kinase domain-containing protein [Ditylenchus destructor]|uniref:Kinase n=1 Tax=Ditylenchus destructor TaxID=166010 RepID=A0AAD4QZ53_9BILA|nr:inositol polyphosphate kinase domain-containing protein [Ditylenchus destructor]